MKLMPYSVCDRMAIAGDRLSYQPGVRFVSSWYPATDSFRMGLSAHWCA
nr:MAG TPA: hypothetical protein [Inoviridae sp.]